MLFIISRAAIGGGVVIQGLGLNSIGSVMGGFHVIDHVQMQTPTCQSIHSVREHRKQDVLTYLVYLDVHAGEDHV